MRIHYLSPWHDSACQDPIELVQARQTLREIAHQMAGRGHEVDVVQSFSDDVDIDLEGVRYRFVRAGRASRMARNLKKRFRLGVLGTLQPANGRAAELAVHGAPDILHFSGLTLDLDLLLATRSAQRANVPIVAQYHGGEPPRNRLRRAVQRRNFAGVERVLFTTADHAQPWIQRGLIDSLSRVSTIMETSSIFEAGPREEARRQTGMFGCPVFLWVGRLQSDKDPITVLSGFAEVNEVWPDARLYIYFQRDDLLDELRALAGRNDRLARSVEFRGRAAREDLAAIYRSADVFVLGSRHEVAGTAVLEAMSCGVIPLVTDIPSFRVMTDDGRCGVLFRPGDHHEMAERVLHISREGIPVLSAAVREHFERQLSYAAIARRLEEIYRDVVDDRRRRATRDRVR